MQIRANPSPTREDPGAISTPQLNSAIENVYVITLEKGGSTYNLFDGCLTGKALYAVAVAPERTVITDGTPTLNQVRSFVLTNLDLLERPHHNIGTWVDKRTGKGYLDISVAVPEKSVAMRIARMTQQKAIFDLLEMREEYL